MLPPPPEPLRHWRVEDAPALARAWADPDIARWNTVPEAADDGDRLDQARSWIERAPARWRAAGAVDLVLPAAGDDEDVVAGEVGVQNRTRDPDRAELSVWVLPEARGRGLATAAVDHVTSWAFTELGLEQCWARVHVANDAARRLFDRLGWDQLGRSGDIVVLARARLVLR